MLKNYNIFITNLIFSICFFFLLFISIQPIQPFDEFFYLQTGLDLLEKGLSPWIDHYSFTFYGQTIQSSPLFYEVTFATIVKLLGLIAGYKFFLAFQFFLILVALYRYAKTIKTNWIVLLLIFPVLFYFLLLRNNPRPELLSNVLIIVSLMLYFKARLNFGNKELFLISLLLLFWVNWHVPIFGYIIFFALFIDKFFDKVSKRDNSFSWLFWSLWGITIFCIGFAHLGQGHFFINTLLFMGQDWGSIVSEFKPVESNSIYTIQNNLLWIAGGMSVLFFLLKRSYGLAFIIIILIVTSIQMHRLLTQSAIIIFLLFMYTLSHEDTKKIISSLNSKIKVSLTLVSIIIVIFSLNLNMYIINYLLLPKELNQLKENLYPTDIVNYLKKYKQGGNIFNEFGIGGYYIYNLAPEFKVFWDGRLTLLYPYKFAKKYADANSNYAQVFSNEVNNYPIDYVILRIDPLRYFIIAKHKNYKLEYISSKFFLFSKDKKHNFNLSSKLSLFPMCWNRDMHINILEEKKKAKYISLEKDSRINSLFNIIETYNNKIYFYSIKYITNLKTNAEKRLVAYIALKSGKYEDAIFLFKNLSNQNTKDMLMLIHAFEKTNQLKKAEKIISTILSKEKSEILKLKPLKSFEKAVILTLIEQIKDRSSFNAETKADIERLKNNFNPEKFNYTLPLKSIFPEEGCKQLFPEYIE